MIKVRIKKIVEMIFLLLLILEGNTMYMQIVGLREWIWWAALAILFFIVVCYSFLCQRISYRLIFESLFVVIWFAVYILISRYNADGVIKLSFYTILIFVMTNLLINQDELENLLFLYRDIIVVLSIISIFFWIFGSLLHVIPNSGYIDQRWTAGGWIKPVIHYSYLHFEPQIESFFGLKNIIRNTGIFVEAPMYSFHLSLAFGIEIFFDNKINIFRSCILAVTVVTTFSTTGILLLIFYCGMKFIISNNNKKRWKQTVKLLAVPVSCLTGILLFIIVLKQKLTTNAGGYRLFQFFDGFQKWLGAPLFGYGYGNMEWNTEIGFSNGLFMILNYGGVYFLLMYVFCIYMWIRNSMRNGKVNYIIFIVGVAYLIVMTIVQYKWLTLFILMMYKFPAMNEKVEHIGKEAIYFGERTNKRV